MLAHLRRSVILAVIVLAFFGLVYPLVGTGVAQLLFKHQADGSITANGSTLIGQNWTSTKFFHGRPDDAGPYAANPKATPPVSGGDNPLVANGVSGESGATNWGPRAKTLVQNTRALVDYWHKLGVNPTPNLVTTSGSGLDPDISPADALAQIPMVSNATGLSPARLRQLISSQTHGAQLGFLGSSYLNVLQLNEALAKLR
jgi:K+-transporting ATPase ATPase C chain